MHFCRQSFFVVLSIFDHKITLKKCILQNAYNHPSLSQGHILVAAKWVAPCASCQIFLEKALTLRRISNSFWGHNGVDTLDKMGKLFGQLQGDNFILATRFFFIQNFIFQKKATKVLDVAPQGMSLKKIHRRHMSKFSLQKLAILKVKQFQFWNLSFILSSFEQEINRISGSWTPACQWKNLLQKSSYFCTKEIWQSGLSKIIKTYDRK